MDETAEVLERDFEYSKNEGRNVIEVIEKILLFVNLIEPKQKIDIIKDDPDDNKIIECAFESSSDYIVTYDKHLLKLKEYKGIKILKPEEILKEFWNNHMQFLKKNIWEQETITFILRNHF